MLNDSVKPQNDEIIETTGASLQGETGKVFLQFNFKFHID